MKTNKLRARRLWANWYPEVVICRPSRADGLAACDRSYPHGVRVLVIPLDDVPALKSAAYNAYFEAVENNRDSMECVVSALAAIGVLPRQRKGGRK